MQWQLRPLRMDSYTVSFSGHLWVVVLWLSSSRRTTSRRQVAPHGRAGGMWRWKATEKLAGVTKHHVQHLPLHGVSYLIPYYTLSYCSC